MREIPTTGISTGAIPAIRGRRSRKRSLLVAGFAIAFALVWFARLRGTGWSQLVNPVYWYHRVRGDDLFLADQSMLLHGNRALPEVAVTFDDGPHPESRGRILDVLRQFGAHATFFDVGANMALHPELVERTIRDGSEVGNHSENHIRLDTLKADARHREVNDVDIEYASITGDHLSLLRPPGMRYNDDVVVDARGLGYILVSYTTASRDFDPAETSATIAERTLRRTENGSIILLHDYAATADALPAILQGLRERGFKCVTVSAMLAHLPASARQHVDADRTALAP